MKKEDIRKNFKPIKIKSYIQYSSTNINNIIKIKENFLNLLWKRIKEVYRVIYDQKKVKPKINMMTKDPLHRQIIIPMNSENLAKIWSKSVEYITNINSALRSIKSYIIVDFIHSDHRRLIIITNNVMSVLDLNTVKKYIKSIDSIWSENVLSPCLLQSKSYLKILGISYYDCMLKISINSNLSYFKALCNEGIS